MLNGDEILDAVQRGDIVISDFDESRLNPNSYNLRLDKTRMGYRRDRLLDMARENKPDIVVEMTKDGYVLDPSMFYLGNTVEETETHKYVPMIEGRSSVARLGMGIHLTAGFGDVGFKGTWTLEIFTQTRLKVYPDVDICQIFYHEITPTTRKYIGKYNNQKQPQPSRMYRDFT